jgi:hypothetical protein
VQVNLFLVHRWQVAAKDFSRLQAFYVMRSGAVFR